MKEKDMDDLAELFRMDLERMYQNEMGLYNIPPDCVTDLCNKSKKYYKDKVLPKLYPDEEGKK